MVIAAAPYAQLLHCCRRSRRCRSRRCRRFRHSHCTAAHRHAQDCDCCPVAPLVASGLVTGDVFVHRYGDGDDDGGDEPGSSGGDDDEEEGEAKGGGSRGAKKQSAAAQRQQRGASTSANAAAASSAVKASRVLRRRGKGGASCRAVRFAADGSGLVCGYESGSLQLLDLETGKLAARLPAAHGAGVTRLLCLDGSSGGRAPAGLVVAGDEDGGLKIWDVRAGNGAPVYDYKQHTDFISGLAQRHGDGGGSSGGSSGGVLVAVSGDGTLSVHDLRKGAAVARSEDDADDEMLSGG
jgi:hypothetical protein